jgi:hypothetical protein
MKAATWTGWWVLTDDARGFHTPLIQRNNIRQFQRKLHNMLTHKFSFLRYRISNFMSKKAQFNVALK